MSSCTFLSTWRAGADNGGKGGSGGREEEEGGLGVEGVDVVAERRELQISNCRIRSESGRSMSMYL